MNSDPNPLSTTEAADEQQVVQQAFNELLNDYLNSNHRKKVDIITKAFNFANQSHKGVKRRSGEPYILHPIAVARIVTKELGLGSTSICAALLHDVVEDTEFSVGDIRSLFGDKIAEIVDGLTKISGGIFGDKASEQAENFRKLLITMSDDIRVILIKIADRLHNMRTLGSMAPHKQYKIAGETLYIYAPLAHRLGLFQIKTELEDLAFKYEQPEQYEEILEKLKISESGRNEIYKAFVEPLNEKLDALGIHYKVKARVKSAYSIWKKMQSKGIPFEEVYDILAIRIVYDCEPGIDEKKMCWEIYAIITGLYKHHPERIRDWINSPKANGYQALHLTVMGPWGNWVEVQIRSNRMDEIAEKGYAAHWKYKSHEQATNPESQKEGELEEFLRTIKDILDNPEPNAIDFLDTIKLNLYASEIFVFTPKGDMRTLPQGSTALDFAFSLHTEMGYHCIGAKVNHRLVAINHILSSGDQVEILTSKTQEPQTEWLEFVTTAKARAKIRVKFKREYKFNLKKGEKIVTEFLEPIGLKPNNEMVEQLMDHYKINQKEDLYYKIGKGAIVLTDAERILLTEKGNIFVRYWKLSLGKKSHPNKSEVEKKEEDTPPQKGATKIQLIDTDNNKEYKLATCCHPIPGDPVLGYAEQDKTITVHKRDCPIALKLKSNFGKRIISAEWGTQKLLSFPITLSIKGIDQLGIVNKITEIISKELEVNMRKLSIESNNGIFYGEIVLYVHHVADVNNLCMKISKLEAIRYVKRVSNHN